MIVGPLLNRSPEIDAPAAKDALIAPIARPSDGEAEKSAGAQDHATMALAATLIRMQRDAEWERAKASILD